MENNLNNDKLLVSSIRNSEWIDLSAGHKSLRTSIEDQIRSACVDKNDTSPIMVKGAFGIGKTATLHYLFHYAWTILGVPSFMLNLDDIIVEIRNYLSVNKLEKLPNKDVSKVIGEILSIQVNLLKSTNFDEIVGSQINFPSFDQGNLTDYLSKFKEAILHTTNNGEYKDEKLPILNLVKINEAVKSDNRYLLLIDEFEAKYQELKGLIESSGGGMLRHFFDDIASISSTNYYCIIGNGPASGYELNQDLKEKSESNAAEQRRIFVKQLQMPTVASLSKTFLKGFPKEYINFIWWLSRSRPGQIKKLKDNLQSLTEMKEHSFDAFIRENVVFKDPIDDTGEANVIFLKSEIFNDFPSPLQLEIKESLLCLAPRKILLIDEDRKNLFFEGKEIFTVSKDRIEYDKLKDAIKKDFNKQEDYKSVDAEKISHYLDLILESISDNDKKICFGFLDKSNIDKALVDTFLHPICSILYDMITIYEDENDNSIKKVLEFLLSQNRIIDDYNKIDKTYSNVYNLFDINQQREDELYIQLNLKTIREAIEQPIGSPKLPYKSESIESKIKNVDSIENIFIWNKINKEEIIIIPNYGNDELLDCYLETLKNYFIDNWTEKKSYFGDGELITNIVYLEDNEKIEEFKKWLCYDDEEELPFKLKRLDVKHIDSYQIHNTQRISDFISSITQIATIGIYNEEIEEKQLKLYSDKEDDNILRIEKICEVLLNAFWTESKQTRRTIEYFKDLLLVGQNSVFESLIKSAKTNFSDKLNEIVPNTEKIKNSLLKITVEDKIFEEAHSYQTKNLFNLLIAEIKPEDLTNLVTILKNSRDFKLRPSLENSETEVSLVDLFFCFEKNKFLNKNIDDYKNSSISKYLMRFSELLSEYEDIKSLKDLIDVLNQSKTTASSYYKALYFYESNIPYLNGFYYLALSKKISYDTEILIIKKELEDIQKEFSDLEGELSDLLYDLKELTITIDELNYNIELRTYNTNIIQPLTQLLINNSNISYLILTQIFCKYLRNSIKRANRFKIQINRIVEEITTKKTIIDAKQNEFDTIYQSSEIHKKLISKSKTKNFFYGEKFVKSFKIDNTFNLIFGDLNKFKPSDKYFIEDNEFESFIASIKRSYDKKLPEINKEIEEVKEIDAEIKEVLKIEESLRTLITTQDNE